MDNSTNRFTHFVPFMMASGNRSVNASSAERSILLGVIAAHLGILDARDNDSMTLRHKSLLWDQVTRRFNALSSLPRSRHQIQTLFKNMKAKAKKYQSRMIEAQIENTPHAMPEPDAISEILLQLIAGQHQQKILSLKHTAFSVSTDLSFNPPVEDLMEEFPSQVVHNQTPLGMCPDFDSSEIEIKNEPIPQESPMAERFLIEHPQSNEVGAVSNSPNQIMGQSLSNETESANHGIWPLNFADKQSPGPSLPRAGISVKRSPTWSLPSFNECQPQGTPVIQDFSEQVHTSKSADPPLSPMSGSLRQCCCPALHTELVAMAKEEHELRLIAVEEERRFKAEQHTEKRKLLELEQEFCRRKLRLTDKIIAINNQEQDKDQSSESFTFPFNQLEKLCRQKSPEVSPPAASDKNKDTRNMEEFLKEFKSLNPPFESNVSAVPFRPPHTQ